MNRSTSRSMLAGLVVVGGLALAGCGSGQVSQTATQKPTVDGQMAQVGQLAIRDAALDYPVGGSYERGSDARLRMVVVNDGVEPDALVSVSSPLATDATISEAGAAEAAGSASASGSETASPSATPSDTASGTAAPSDSAGGTPSGSAPTPTAAPTPENARIQIPPNNYVSFREDGPRVMLTGLTQRLLPGQNLSVTLTFERAGSVTMTIAVGTPETELAPAPTVSVDPDSESEG